MQPLRNVAPSVNSIPCVQTHNALIALALPVRFGRIIFESESHYIVSFLRVSASSSSSSYHRIAEIARSKINCMTLSNDLSVGCYTCTRCNSSSISPCLPRSFRRHLVLFSLVTSTIPKTLILAAYVSITVPNCKHVTLVRIRINQVCLCQTHRRFICYLFTNGLFWGRERHAPS